MSNLKIVHDGIKCNNCGEENIEGIRYKCTVCPDFNLCQKCETEAIHPPRHIFIKMRRPVKDEDLKLDKDKCKYSYKNEDYDFSIDDRNLIFSIENKENGTLAKQIAITNNGFEEWNPGAKFKCLDSSQLKGKDYVSEVKYWMAYDGNNFGIHDASWRSNFGSMSYKTTGSHGCVNVPTKAMKKLYFYH